MPIVTLRELLEDADRRHYGVGMFDVLNLEMTSAAIEAAERERSPIIIALAEVHAQSVRSLEDISNIAVYSAGRAKVPVAVHYDHGMDRQNLLRVMRLGFSSVMFDGSMLALEENIRRTAEIVELARLFGCSVEGELGHVGGTGETDGEACAYTDPGQAREFVERTGVDALAVSIGTVHGVYREKPCLDLERLRAIKERAGVPLVLHGGSGLTEEDFKNCIRAGISKVNIYTEIVQAAMARISSAVTVPGGAGAAREMPYPTLMQLSAREMRDVIAAKLRVFGSSGRA